MRNKKMLSLIKTIIKFSKRKYLLSGILLFEMMVSTTITPFHNRVESTSAQEGKTVSIVNRSFDKGFPAKKFYSVVVDEDNTKWFLTDTGIVSFDGKKWLVHNKNRKVPTENLKGLAFEVSSYGPELWIASSKGATVVSLPVDARSGATTYDTQNTTILSDNVLSVAIGKGPLRWFGTDKGISAFLDNKWLPFTGYSYQREYPESLFRDFPITCMATSSDGNFVYAGTEGGGVARVFRNEVDGISGASVHSYWGPINMPSDKVYSICIAPDGTQWYGTNRGVARHTGNITLDNWTVFDTGNGLIDNFVQSIAIDKNGNLWFGTKSGVSVFNGTIWTSFSLKEGLNSNNILCITSDKNGVLWLGTDNGVMSYNNEEFICYK
jgi:ligand-binding sensor domain-containing protein